MTKRTRRLFAVLALAAVAGVAAVPTISAIAPSDNHAASTDTAKGSSFGSKPYMRG